MNLSSLFSWRYFWSRKKKSAINLISGISVTIFTLGAAVMLVILSFMNGLEKLVMEMNSAFDPDLKITYTQSKTFPTEKLFSELQRIQGIDKITQVLEENAVLRYDEGQEIVKVKGVSSEFEQTSSLNDFVIQGYADLKDTLHYQAMFGSEVAARLKINPRSTHVPAQIFVPRKGVKYNPLNPDASLNAIAVLPRAIVIINEEKDRDVVILPIEAARKLLSIPRNVSALEISVKPEYEAAEVQNQIDALLEDGFVLRNRNEQNETAYAVFKSEKWTTFAILSLILLISTFNILGALTMLVIDKKEDAKVLLGLGARIGLIRSIFFRTGLLISFLGIVFGLMLGGLFVWAQLNYGLIKLEGSFVEAFPIAFKPTDLLLVLGSLGLLGALASYFPAKMVLTK
jgi:lipoprotein-releasing system permease protein